MSVEYWWIDADKGKTVVLGGGGGGEPLCLGHLIQQKTHMDWPGIENGPPRWEEFIDYN
jgi:hypothetical protein